LVTTPFADVGIYKPVAAGEIMRGVAVPCFVNGDKRNSIKKWNLNKKIDERQTDKEQRK